MDLGKEHSHQRAGYSRADACGGCCNDLSHAAAPHWIHGAIEHKGALTRKAHAAGESPMEFARQHEHDSGTTGRQARLAETLRGMHHK